MPFDFDLLVIGAGSGGVRASRMAAQTGAKVAVVEDTHFGGTCVNVGCVPKKLFAISAHYADDFVDAQGYGWQAKQITFDWPTLRDNKTKEITRLSNIYKSLLEKNNVTIFNGTALFVDEHTVAIGDKKISAERILIATGNAPFLPPIPGHELAITSNEAFYLDKLPERMIIVGGGYIAVEFASIFSNLGVQVTLVYRGELFLRKFDDDIRHFLAASLAHKNITLKFNTDIASLHKKEQTIIATTHADEKIDTNLVLFATGRLPNTQQLNLKKLGVKLSENGAILVNDSFQSSVPSIYALGDVIDRMQLTPVALAEAMAFVATVFANKPTHVDYHNIPTAVFSDPTVGTVGLTEEQARQQYGDVAIYRSTFKALKNTLSGRDEKTLMKIIVDKKTDKVIGVHMVGNDAGEIIQGFAVALKAGATKAIFDTTVGIHPTAAEEFVTMRE